MNSSYHPQAKRIRYLYVLWALSAAWYALFWSLSYFPFFTSNPFALQQVMISPFLAALVLFSYVLSTPVYLLFFALLASIQNLFSFAEQSAFLPLLHHHSFSIIFSAFILSLTRPSSSYIQFSLFSIFACQARASLAGVCITGISALQEHFFSSLFFPYLFSQVFFLQFSVFFFMTLPSFFAAHLLRLTRRTAEI